MKLILESTDNLLVNSHGGIAREWRGVTGKGHTVKVVIVGVMPVPLTEAALEELAADLATVVTGTTADDLRRAFEAGDGPDGSFKLTLDTGDDADAERCSPESLPEGY